MFQAYRVKMQKMVYPGVRSYIYRNCSIAVSREDGKLVVSIAPHDFEKPPRLPDKPELNDLLSYFGIDPASPMKHTVSSIAACRAMATPSISCNLLRHIYFFYFSERTLVLWRLYGQDVYLHRFKILLRLRGSSIQRIRSPEVQPAGGR